MALGPAASAAACGGFGHLHRACSFHLHSRRCWTKCLPRNQFPASFSSSSPSAALLPPSPRQLRVKGPAAMGSFWELSASYVQKKPRCRCNPECWDQQEPWK